MTVAIKTLIDQVLKQEGGYVNHPDDKGGPTHYGITQATLSQFLQRPVTVDEVKALDIDTAREIYESRYYRAPQINQLPDRIQPFVFDSAVNHGPRQAIKFVQQVCNEAGFGPLAIDGLMGPNTEKAAAACNDKLGDWMLVALVEERQMFYINIVTQNETQIVFLKGWMNRARSFLPSLGAPPDPNATETGYV